MRQIAKQKLKKIEIAFCIAEISLLFTYINLHQVIFCNISKFLVSSSSTDDDDNEYNIFLNVKFTPLLCN